MTVVYKHLRQQKFPPLGQHLNIITALRNSRRISADNVFQETVTRPPIRQYPVFKLLSNTVQRRSSSIGRLFGKQDSHGNDDVSLNKGSENSRWLTKRIKRPIDFRFSGAPICSYFKNIDDLIFLYLSILSEKRLIVVSSRLR